VELQLGRERFILYPALSLQDVFSDSANLAGRQQKTSCPFNTGRVKLAQLGKEKGCKSKMKEEYDQ
jgi:hypothetical protein